MLNTTERRAVDEILRESCDFRGWPLHALNVRTNHVHIVLTSNKLPDDTMGMLKSRATRMLRERGILDQDKQLWARHGSTIYLFKQQQLDHAIWYTHEAQDGERFELPD